MKYPLYSFNKSKQWGKDSFLAGCIDCDGSIYIQRSNMQQVKRKAFVYRLRIDFSNTNKTLLDYCVLRYGGKLRFSKVTKGGKNYWHWGFGGDEAYRLIRKIEPLLVAKKEQARVAIRFQEKKMRLHRRHRSDEFVKWEEEQYNKMCKLNA